MYQISKKKKNKKTTEENIQAGQEVGPFIGCQWTINQNKLNRNKLVICIKSHENKSKPELTDSISGN